MLILAVPGVLIATGLTGCFVKYVFPYDWGWAASLMVGGMLSATDAVAVVALLKELGESRWLVRKSGCAWRVEAACRRGGAGRGEGIRGVRVGDSLEDTSLAVTKLLKVVTLTSDCVWSCCI